MVEINNLTVEFKNKTIALNKVNLSINEGIYGLLGENGAGKTTLMRTLTTILKPTKGEMYLGNLRYCENNYEKIKQKIGYLPQELNIYPNLTVRESLEYLGELAGVPKKDCRNQVDFYLEKTNLTQHQYKKNRQLSGGMKRRVGLVQALLNNPEFLIVDEPTTGLDPEERIRIRNLLVEFSSKRTVLFSTHVVEDLAATCKQLAIIKKGKILYVGKVLELLEKAKGHIWLYQGKSEEEIIKIEKRYHTTSKQYTENGLSIKIISTEKPDLNCTVVEATLEDAYIYELSV